MIKANVPIQDRVALINELLEWHYDGYVNKWTYTTSATIGMELMIGGISRIVRDEKFPKVSFRLRCWGKMRRENPQLLAKLNPFFFTEAEELEEQRKAIE
jgi:hypothetical protein